MTRQILTTILFLFQFSLFGQNGEQQKAVIQKNKVKTVKVYIKVPKTNPDYFQKPRGYMRIGQSSYDQDGRLIEKICPECDELSTKDEKTGYPRHSFIDRHEKYFYENDRLTMREESGKETKLYKYHVDSINNRQLVIGTNKGKRFLVTIETLDKSNRPTQIIDITIGYSWTEGDTARQIFFRRTVIHFTPLTKTIQEYGNRNGTGIDIDKRTFDIFQNSVDPKEIENGFFNLELGDKLQTNGQKIISYDKKGDELKFVQFDTESIFYRNKAGLITKEIYKYPKFSEVREYRYEFWR